MHSYLFLTAPRPANHFATWQYMLPLWSPPAATGGHIDQLTGRPITDRSLTTNQPTERATYLTGLPNNAQLARTAEQLKGRYQWQVSMAGINDRFQWRPCISTQKEKVTDGLGWKVMPHQFTRSDGSEIVVLWTSRLLGSTGKISDHRRVDRSDRIARVATISRAQ